MDQKALCNLTVISKPSHKRFLTSIVKYLTACAEEHLPVERHTTSQNYTQVNKLMLSWFTVSSPVNKPTCLNPSL